MKLLFHILALAALFTMILAWDKEDYEIFDLVSAVENSEGKGATFYSWLGVSEKASSGEINKAYRKKSLELHPDKNHGVKGANERYARLGVVAQILRSEGRERYDFWMKRGVPKWRGTGYYYNRFRPGLGTVFVFLTLITSLLQNLVHRMTYKSELSRVRTFMKLARQAAWGTNQETWPSKMESSVGKPRKVKVNIKGNPDVEGEEQEYIPGRTIEMLVEGEEVYLLEEGERHVIDENVPLRPSYKRTWPFALGGWIISLIRRDKSHGSEMTEDEGEEGGEDEHPENGGGAGGSSSSDEVKVTKMPVAASKSAGRRRKGAKR